MDDIISKEKKKTIVLCFYVLTLLLLEFSLSHSEKTIRDFLLFHEYWKETKIKLNKLLIIPTVKRNDFVHTRP